MGSRSSNIDLSKLLSPESLKRAYEGVREMLAKQKACGRKGHVEGVLMSDNLQEGSRRVQCSRCGDTYRVAKTSEEMNGDYDRLHTPMSV